MNKTEIFLAPTRLLSTALNGTSSLVALSLTHIRYKAGDLLGWSMGWFSLLPVFIAFGGFTTLMLFRRELQTYFFAMGIGVSETTNQIIKAFVKEPRPATCQDLEACDTHGWPSSHSQFMCFFAVYITYLSTQKITFSADYVKKFTIALPWACASIVMYSRVYLGYHSWGQVLAGATVGIILGSIWFQVVNKYCSPKFHDFEESQFCRCFRIKDSSHIPDVIGFEYKSSRAHWRELNKEPKSPSTFSRPCRNQQTSPIPMQQKAGTSSKTKVKQTKHLSHQH